MNTVIISGTIGKEPKVNDSGKIATVSLAVQDKLKGQDGKFRTSWVNLKVLGEKKVATIQKWWSKGMKIMVTGSLDFKSEKKDGSYVMYDYVLVESWEFMGGKVEGKSDGEASASNSGDEFMPVPDNMDIDSIFS